MPAVKRNSSGLPGSKGNVNSRAKSMDMNHQALFFTFLLTLAATPAFSQDDGLLAFEQRVENAVVEGDTVFLKTAYADDFRFKHGTGLVDSKSSWIRSVRQAKGKFISRKLDSVEVEIHGDIGITNGQLTVRRKTEKAERKYMIKFVRVYVRRNEQWQMIMHRTVYEKDY
jgi:Domain of unknown function (DUF4440)